MAITPKSYETLYIVRPDITTEELSKIQDKLENSITSNEGNITRADKWAERDLAYTIKDYKKGTYYILEYSTLPEGVAQIEKHLGFHNTEVLRFMTVDLSEQKAQDTQKEQTQSNGGGE